MTQPLSPNMPSKRKKKKSKQQVEQKKVLKENALFIWYVRLKNRNSIGFVWSGNLLMYGRSHIKSSFIFTSDSRLSRKLCNSF